MARRGYDKSSITTPYASRASMPFFAVDYGAVADGVTDDTTAIGNALVDASANGGGRIILPDSPCLISQPLIGTSDNLELLGQGWASQLIAAPGFPAGPMIQIQGPGGAGNFRYGIRIANLFLNGNSVAGVGGLDLVSCYGALLDHVRTRYMAGIAVHWDGASGAFGAYNYMRDCHITDGVGAAAVAVQTDSSEWLTIESGHIGYYQNAGNVGVKLQNLNNRVLGVSFDYCDTSVVCAFAGRNHIIGCQFDRGWTRFIYLESAASCVVTGNFFGVRSGAGPEAIRVDGANNDKSVITGNSVQTASGWPLFVQEYASTAGVNTYADNDTGGLSITLKTGIARGNHGYNPIGSIAAPAIPATTVAYTNAFGVDATVHVTGGTVTAIAIGGVATGLTAGSFRIPAGQTITLTYSVAPTWTWYGD